MNKLDHTNANPRTWRVKIISLIVFAALFVSFGMLLFTAGAFLFITLPSVDSDIPWVLQLEKLLGQLGFFGLIAWITTNLNTTFEKDRENLFELDTSMRWLSYKHPIITFILLLIAVPFIWESSVARFELPYLAYSTSWSEEHYSRDIEQTETHEYRELVLSSRQKPPVAEKNSEFTSRRYMFWQLAAADGYRTSGLVEANSSSHGLLFLLVPLLAVAQSILILFFGVIALLPALVILGLLVEAWRRYGW